MESDSKLFQLENPRGIVQTQSKSLRKIQDTVSRFNDSAKIRNEVKQKGPRYSGDSSPMLLCSLCEGTVKRRTGTSKNRTELIGFAKILIPQYRCSVCGTHYSGFLPNIVCDSNSELECKIVEYSGVR